jgi:hypothetical protein
MKKIFTILCAGILTLGLSAQTESGNMLVGVSSNAGFTSFSPEGGGDGVTSMNLGVSGGYFVIDNLALTANFGFAQVGDADAVTSFGIGGRYYMGSMFAGVGYSIPGEDLSDLTLGAGYSKMLTDNIALEPSLGYTMHSWDGESYGSSFRLNIGFALYF